MGWRMRNVLQIPLWWTVMLSLAVYLGSLDKNITAALVFAIVFGIVFGGGMMAMKPLSRRPRSSRHAPPKQARRRHPARQPRLS